MPTKTDKVQIQRAIDYNKQHTKQFTLRLKTQEYNALQAYLKQKGEGFAPLVKRLLAEEMNRDGWTGTGESGERK